MLQAWHILESLELKLPESRKVLQVQDDIHTIKDFFIREDQKRQVQGQRPKIVCLCGSTRFFKAFQKANLEETIAGNIVLSVGCDTKSDTQLFKGKDPAELQELKRGFDELHLKKIDLADEVLILNVDGYIGESTKKELEYARQAGKVVRFLEPGSAV